MRQTFIQWLNAEQKKLLADIELQYEIMNDTPDIHTERLISNDIKKLMVKSESLQSIIDKYHELNG